MRVIFLDTDEHVAQWVAHYVVYSITTFHPTCSRPFILGLPTGTTPIQTYKKLIQMHQLNQISFKNVVIFTMDEYLGIHPEDSRSHCSFIYTHFINHIDVLKKNINVLNGNPNNVYHECQRYEEKIKTYGKINLLLGGVGINGHLAFNEPGSSLKSRTRVKCLTQETRLYNSKFFNNNLHAVPKFALTIGIATLLESQEIIIIAIGKNKAIAVQSAIEGNINHMWTISSLQLHPKAILVCDTSSTMELKTKTIKYFQELEIINDQ